ncbi:uncharacterized protein LOC122357992 isoform X2 [Puntigrus tetrazona]|nr:uncharacterized protein LOC122357992 isoform X2 [Puntigrus tetrazona]
MSRRVEVIINSSAPQDQDESPLQITESKPGNHPGVKGFLLIKPAVLGWLEILTGSCVFGLVYWNYTLWLLIPACLVILIGVITCYGCMYTHSLSGDHFSGPESAQHLQRVDGRPRVLRQSLLSVSRRYGGSRSSNTLCERTLGELLLPDRKHRLHRL